MKKLCLFFMVLLVIFLICCKAEPQYSIGDIGPAGGIIFYDKGKYSDGWRYLEAAPADLKVVNGVPTVDKTVNGYSLSSGNYIFGYHRYSYTVSNLFVNNTKTYNAADCTGTAIGTGKSNTWLLIGLMSSKNAYSEYSGSIKTSDYAAGLCWWNLEFNGFDDWFLPSKDELNLMYENRSVIGGFVSGYYYWSSSEFSGDAGSAWVQSFSNGEQYYVGRSYMGRVRPVRAF